MLPPKPNIRKRLALWLCMSAWQRMVVTGVLSVGLWALPAAAQSLRKQVEAPVVTDGIVIRVVDGDTVWVKPVGQSASKPYWRIRLLGMDAPESCQAHGREATQALTKRLLQQRVTVAWHKPDVYGRWLATLSGPGSSQDVGAWMVGEGHAWSYRYKKNVGPYARQEQQARAAKRGLFAASDALEPRVFRRTHGSCRSAKARRGG